MNALDFSFLTFFLLKPLKFPFIGYAIFRLKLTIYQNNFNILQIRFCILLQVGLILDFIINKIQDSPSDIFCRLIHILIADILLHYLVLIYAISNIVCLRYNQNFWVLFSSGQSFQERNYASLSLKYQILKWNTRFVSQVLKNHLSIKQKLIVSGELIGQQNNS